MLKSLQNPQNERVVQTLTEEAPMIHFSCHGEVDYDFPWRNKILLKDWEEDPFTVQDIYEFHLSNQQNSQVAFLSACFTANARLPNATFHFRNLNPEHTISYRLSCPKTYS